MSFPVSTPINKPVSRPGVNPGPAFPKTLMEWPNYLKATAQEWGLISWPSQLQIVGLTGLVVVIVTAMTLMLWGIDNGLRFAVHFITPH